MNSSAMLVIKRPLITEKITRLQDKLNTYAFEVDRTANKIEIKKAVEARFKVDVVQVRTINVAGKIKRLGKFTGRRPDWKKAIVTLGTGQSIDLSEGA